MGGRRMSSDARRDDESAASLFGRSRSPRSAAGSSPSPLRLDREAPAKTARPATGRRHVVIRIIRSPFAAVLRMTTCARSGTAGDGGGDEPRSNNGDSKVVGMTERVEPRRRPSLEELLRMEASASSRPEHKVSGPLDTAAADPYDDKVSDSRWKESAIVVFGFPDDARVDDDDDVEEEEEEPLSRSKSHHAVVVDDVDERHQTAIVPVEHGGDVMLSRTAQMNVNRLVLVLRALARALIIRMDMKGTSNASYQKLAGGGGGAAGKAELFYYRPIPMGRRCRVQHLEDSLYM